MVCFKGDFGGKIKIVDFICVFYNLQCLSKMFLLMKKMNKLNEIFFDVFCYMSKEGEQVVIVQLEVNRVRINYDVVIK